MKYGYTPVEPDRMVKLVLYFEKVAKKEYKLKSDDEIASFIVSKLTKAISYDDFNKVLIYKLILKILDNGNGETFNTIKNALDKALKRLTKEEVNEIERYLRMI